MLMISFNQNIRNTDFTTNSIRSQSSVKKYLLLPPALLSSTAKKNFKTNISRSQIFLKK